MAGAAAAIRSCFPSVQPRQPPGDGAAKLATLRALRLQSEGLQGLRLRANVPRRLLARISAAVAEEAEAAEAAEAAAQEGDQEPVADIAGESRPNTKLYFGNLPYNCDSAQLAGIIQEFATPEMVEVLYDKDTGRSRGFGFVTMSSLEDCERVINNLDGFQYSGRALRVNFSDKPKPKDPLYPESENKLFVGNLSWSVTAESLIQAFQDYGEVVGARVIFDGDTGRSRGYGFVCYSTKSEMEAAMRELDGKELEGRAMRISLALGKRS
ncbi:RNA-binding (RRM/RBD/RNP motifs) family protein [Wolffia australiana]